MLGKTIYSIVYNSILIPIVCNAVDASMGKVGC